MSDFTFITPRLATGGGVNSAVDAQALKAAGITHIIDCRDDVDDAPVLTGLGLAYLWNPTPDDGLVKPPAWFATSLTFALGALVQPHTRVLNHCAAGINRGPSTAFGVMRALGWTAVQAEALIRAVRPQVGLRYKADADAAVSALGYT